MSDNSSQQGSDTIATDDVGGIKYQRVKVTFGADGSATDVSTSNLLPVDASGVAIDINSLPAADRATDTLGAALATDALSGGSLANGNLTSYTPKFAKITASSSGATTIVSAVTSKKIRVLAWSLVCNAAVNVKWQSHVTPTDLTGLHYFGANGGISVPLSPVGHFETVAGEALDINLSGAQAVGGSLVYIEV